MGDSPCIMETYDSKNKRELICDHCGKVCEWALWLQMEVKGEKHHYHFNCYDEKYKDNKPNNLNPKP